MELDEAIQKWKLYNKSKQFDNELEEMISENDRVKLECVFLKRLNFGTAGLRARMGPGFARINDVTIVQTTQGISQYLRNRNDVFKNDKKCVVIGYDARYLSERFARLASAVFVESGVPVYLFSGVCPTPFVAYAVKHLNAMAGIMITASHNPKHDNGYKVYLSNGAQIIPPHDKEIQDCILKNLIPNPNIWTVADEIIHKRDHYKVFDPMSEVSETYFKELSKCARIFEKSSVKVTYTSLHGVGYEFMKNAFEACKLQPFIPVKEQVVPDPEFPTVEFPNPEEGEKVFKLAFKVADENSSQIVIANDPDADRMGVAVKTEGKWVILSGNEIGALLAWWVVQECKEMDKTSRDACYFLGSAVSSKDVKCIAHRSGFQYEETLTGFKWMGNRAWELAKDNKKVLFAFEEAIGFMVGCGVLDKDGVSAGVHFTNMCNFLYANGIDPIKQLARIRTEYGFSVTKNSYFFCEDPEIIKRIFRKIRNFEDSNGDRLGKYPRWVGESVKYEVVGIRDLETGLDSNQKDGKATLPIVDSNQMITFTMDNGVVCTFRASGTEPKLKYYSEIMIPPSDELNIAQEEECKRALIVLEETLKALIEELLQPVYNKLKPASGN